MRIGAVILSRYSSSRLPGKALKEIRGKKTLAYIIERLLRVLDREFIVLATSTETSDDKIADFAGQMNVKCYRGSLENVAERFYYAAEEQSWDFAIRINGDNIFADTDVLSRMIDVARTGKYDFVSNVKGRTFPKGMSIEIVRMNYYKKQLASISISEEYKQHVTSYLYDHDKGQDFYYFLNTEYPQAAGIQLALDTEEDFQRTKEIISHFALPHYKYNLKEILSVIELLKV